MVKTFVFQALCQCFTQIMSNSHDNSENQKRLRQLFKIRVVGKGRAKTWIQVYLTSKDDTKQTYTDAKIEKVDVLLKIKCCSLHVGDWKLWTKVNGVRHDATHVKAQLQHHLLQKGLTSPPWLVSFCWTCTVHSVFILIVVLLSLNVNSLFMGLSFNQALTNLKTGNVFLFCSVFPFYSHKISAFIKNFTCDIIILVIHHAKQ